MLAAALNIEASTLVRLLDRLSKDGWVERKHCPADRRAYHVVLTDKARRACAEIEDVLSQTRHEILSVLKNRKSAPVSRRWSACATRHCSYVTTASRLSRKPAQRNTEPRRVPGALNASRAACAHPESLAGLILRRAPHEPLYPASSSPGMLVLLPTAAVCLSYATLRQQRLFPGASPISTVAPRSAVPRGSGDANILFKILMLPYAALLVIFWHRLAEWLRTLRPDAGKTHPQHSLAGNDRRIVSRPLHSFFWVSMAVLPVDAALRHVSFFGFSVLAQMIAAGLAQSSAAKPPRTAIQHACLLRPVTGTGPAEPALATFL